MILVFLYQLLGWLELAWKLAWKHNLKNQAKTKNNGFIMQFHSFLEFVPKIQELSLPGLSEQLTMAPKIRKQLLEKPIINPKKAAVICLFYEGIHGETCFYLDKKVFLSRCSLQSSWFSGWSNRSLTIKRHGMLQNENSGKNLGFLLNKLPKFVEITPLYIPPSHFWVDCFLAYSTCSN